ncbi:hypothetical protein [Roseomonas chloroacetimidivorans]|uniref:hypothetical protein n=1 Tax=Roseomonas chloroacetimidivorans TaxID=1766656 RepID=UPI003C730C7E
MTSTRPAYKARILYLDQLLDPREEGPVWTAVQYETASGDQLVLVTPERARDLDLLTAWCPGRLVEIPPS